MIKCGACALHAGYKRLKTEYVILIALPLEPWLNEHSYELNEHEYR
jgi:hypothetical protein